jgi:hypothetical protein
LPAKASATNNAGRRRHRCLDRMVSLVAPHCPFENPSQD